jgi:glycogen debranching enzyme
MAPRPPAAEAAPVSIDEAVRRSLALLQANLTPQGILAASPTDAAVARRYTRIFGRDAAICSLAMVGSGVAALERGARDSLDALAAQQAANGQIPKYVDPEGRDADFWYLGCIDATLWWLLAVDDLRRRSPLRGVARRWQRAERRAIDWLRAQEHPHFGLLQQNEASDWADIMPRSGYVLYSNALWVAVKHRFGLAGADVTRHHANHLFHPFQRDLPDYHRARLLQHYARRNRQDPGLYLSFVNFATAGDEGDVFGNLLAIVHGMAGGSMGHRIVATLRAAQAADPWPVRVVLHPLSRADELWRPYMGRHRQNHPHQYHNGGLWPFVGGYWVLALARLGRRDLARRALQALAQANAAADWRFTEWFHGRTLAPMGMAGQSWNAATLLLAARELGRG